MGRDGEVADGGIADARKGQRFVDRSVPPRLLQIDVRDIRVIADVASGQERRDVDAVDVGDLDRIVPGGDDRDQVPGRRIAVRQDVLRNRDVQRFVGRGNNAVLGVVQNLAGHFLHDEGIAGVGVVHHAEDERLPVEREIGGELRRQFGFGRCAAFGHSGGIGGCGRVVRSGRAAGNQQSGEQYESGDIWFFHGSLLSLRG